ncbi:hypothetical protein CCH79_00008313 [Gambusia affinis]|uniref:Transmembrane protein 98 n=2 Tax=Gambusia affinis TaxID=33528 RepID=A0A315V2R3_GAMAF|nr:hypothetical protein CCH79_00008313 [Gambusia affinis]
MKQFIQKQKVNFARRSLSALSLQATGRDIITMPSCPEVQVLMDVLAGSEDSNMPLSSTYDEEEEEEDDSAQMCSPSQKPLDFLIDRKRSLCSQVHVDVRTSEAQCESVILFLTLHTSCCLNSPTSEPLLHDVSYEPVLFKHIDAKLRANIFPIVDLGHRVCTITLLFPPTASAVILYVCLPLALKSQRMAKKQEVTSKMHLLLMSLDISVCTQSGEVGSDFMLLLYNQALLPFCSSLTLKPSFWLFSAETGSSESQTALLDPSPSSLQLPSSTSWSGQPHSAEEEEKAGWKGVEQALYTVRNVKVSREAAGSNLWCTHPSAAGNEKANMINSKRQTEAAVPLSLSKVHPAPLWCTDLQRATHNPICLSKRKACKPLEQQGLKIPGLECAFTSQVWGTLVPSPRSRRRTEIEADLIKLLTLWDLRFAMETVVIVAIGVLATIFLASFVALVVVCRHRYCHPHDLLHHFDSKPTVDLISAMETQSEPSELELDDVVITNPHIEAILENEDWIEDASGLVSHCISILKICHTLTEKLVAMTMGSGAKVKAPASLSDIITVAKRISPRVDDVVRSMYPPLDPILLDARATALLLSVSHLVLVTRNACHMSGSLDWIDQSLHAAEDHMVVLREAALASEPERILFGDDAQREQAI